MAIEIPLTGRNKISVEVNTEENEISVCVIDDEGSFIQDLVVVRESPRKENNFEVLVWGDAYDEDYTSRHLIELYRYP